MEHSSMPQSPKLDIPISVAGWWKLEAIKVDANGNEISRRVAADWFPNLILNNGLDVMGTTNYGRGCVVGSGNSTPTAGQTVLDAFVAGRSIDQATSVQGGQATTAPYYGWYRRTWRFSAGLATGNLSEIGVTTGGTYDALTPLFSRALITDGAGAPTTITILADEILDATYELRQYQNPTDVVTTELINGVLTEVTIRAATAASSYGLFDVPDMSVSTEIFSTQGLGTVLTSPTGTHIANKAQGLSGGVTGTYIGGTYYRDFYIQYGVGYAGNIGAAYLLTTRGIYQVNFNPPVAMLDTQQFRADFRMSWNRYTP